MTYEARPPGNPMELERPDWLLPIETLNEGVLVADNCHQILYVNSCLAEMIGSPASEVVGRTASYFYSPEEYEFMLSQELKAQNGTNRFEFVLPRKDASRMPVIVSVRGLEDPDGGEFWIVTFTDISDQKRAEAELRRQPSGPMTHRHSAEGTKQHICEARGQRQPAFTGDRRR